MNKKFEKISNINFKVIDKPKHNIINHDFDYDIDGYNIKHFKTGLNFYKYHNNNINTEEYRNIYDNTKLKKIKKNIKDLKNEIKKLNILAYEKQKINQEFYPNHISINQNIFGSKYNINKNLIKNEKNQYQFLSAKKNKLNDNNNNYQHIYFSPDIGHIKKKSKFNININNNYNKSLFQNKNIINKSPNHINLYKTKFQFNEIDKNIIKNEKNKINNRIEFNNQNVNHQIIIINNNSNNQKLKKDEKIENDKNKSKDNINIIKVNKIKVNKKEEEIINLKITDEELNIPLIIETLRYNKIIVDKNSQIKEGIDMKNENINDIKNKISDSKEDVNLNQNNINEKDIIKKEIKIDDLANKDICENLKELTKIENSELNRIQNKDEENKIKLEESNNIKKENIIIVKKDKEEIKEENNMLKKEENEEIKHDKNILDKKASEEIKIEEKKELVGKMETSELARNNQNEIKENIPLDIIQNEKENDNNIINEEKNKDNNKDNKNNLEKQEDLQPNEISDEIKIKEIKSKIQKQKNPKKSIRIQINLDNNIIIGYIPQNLITEFAIVKDSTELLDKTSPLNHSFSLYEKIMKESPIPYSSIKKYDKNEIKIDNNYIYKENLEEKDIIPALYNENEEEIKNLEKSLEKSIDKSFDRSYEKSFDKSLNNMSLNQSDSQNLNHSNSLSYNDASFNASRNSIEGLSGKGIIEKLTRMFSGGSMSINKEIEEENNDDNDSNKNDKNEEKEKSEDENQENNSLSEDKNNEEKEKSEHENQENNSLSEDKNNEEKEKSDTDEEKSEEKSNESIHHSNHSS